MTVGEETNVSNLEITNEPAEDTDLEQASTQPEESLPDKEMEDIGEDDTNTDINFSQAQDIDINVIEDPARNKRNTAQEKFDANIHKGPPRKKKIMVMSNFWRQLLTRDKIKDSEYFRKWKNH